jgi:Uma2 family endonuclease
MIARSGHIPFQRASLARTPKPAHGAAMLSVLERPTLRARVPRLSITDYHHFCETNQWAERTELIRGIIIEKMSKSPLHGTIASLLQDQLTPQLPAGHFIRREEPLTLRDSEPEPDLAIVTGARRDYLRAHPTTALLVVEVAVTSADDDRAMSELYVEAGVPEYWLVLPKERAGLSYHAMRRYEDSEELACNSIPSLKVALAELFGDLA